MGDIAKAANQSAWKASRLILAVSSEGRAIEKQIEQMTDTRLWLAVSLYGQRNRGCYVNKIVKAEIGSDTLSLLSLTKQALTFFSHRVAAWRAALKDRSQRRRKASIDVGVCYERLDISS
jgi:hypothetical protein